MEIITQRKAADMMRHSGGKLFSVTFIKRSNGAHRRMTGRVRPDDGWKTGVTGDGMDYNPADRDLVPVREFVSMRDHTPNTRKNLQPAIRCVGTQFRHVSIEGITALKIGGKEFQVEGY